MEMRKANWSTDNGAVNMTMSMSKIDKENRLVHGWATLDNDDLQGDRVVAEASLDAFSRFSGAIREMHQPIAAGKMVKFRPEVFYDVENGGKKYNGIFVTAYVSKGAESTWQKVLDGTLSMFSISGPIKEAHTSLESGNPIRVVTKYDMTELSLVDSGGNQLAHFAGITKSVDGGVSVTGEVMKANIENVFWCDNDRIAKTSTDDSMSCPDGHEMSNIGWYEHDSVDTPAKVMSVVNKYLGSDSGEDQTIESGDNEGGVDVSGVEEKNVVEPGSPVANEVDVAEQGKAENEVDSSNEAAAVSEVSEEAPEAQAADVSEVESSEDDLQKMFDNLEEKINDGVKKNVDEIAKSLGDINEKVSEITVEFEKKFDEFEAKQSEIRKSIETLSEGFEKMQKSVSGLEGESAMKKSADLGGTAEGTLSKNKGTGVWAGSILDA